MPRAPIGRTPYPLVRIDTDEPLTTKRLLHMLENAIDGLSICVRSQNGHPNRGGYFFHIQKQDANNYVVLKTFENIAVGSYAIEVVVRLINHASGLQFDEEMFVFCQNNINFRQDIVLTD